MEERAPSEVVFDLCVIGAGPGGYVAAIRAAQLGMKVACVEKNERLGGTCLNIGCIPSKALLESSERYLEASRHLRVHGIHVEGVSLDLEAMMQRKKSIVEGLTRGISFLFKKNKITRFQGYGRILSAGEVAVEEPDGTKEIVRCRRILIATGSEVAIPSGLEPDGRHVITSTEALELERVPRHLVIIGAGVIGLELGSVWRRLGARVTLIELLPRILNGFDHELADAAQKSLAGQGLEFIVGARVKSAAVRGDDVFVSFVDSEKKDQEIQCDKLLVCVGRRPFVEGLGLRGLGIALDDAGRIAVDDHYETSVKGIFAIGDVIAGPMLAHKAEDEGIAAVERMAGIAGHVRYDAIPSVVYTSPEIAAVGATEERLKEEGRTYRRGTFPFSANGRAKAMGQTEGFVKLLADARSDALLGAHIIGPRAGDLIAELVIGMECGASAEDIARSAHAHPSLAEVVREAAFGVDDRRIHL